MQYYIIKNNNSGMYWRGKGTNAWGQYFNQASIYRIRGQAEATKRDLECRGVQVTLVPICITEDIVNETV